MVRTEDIGNKLTGNIGYTPDWAGALEKRVTDGREATVCQPGGERSFHDDGALRAVRDQPQDGP